jgi:hypothetical protein
MALSVAELPGSTVRLPPLPAVITNPVAWNKPGGAGPLLSSTMMATVAFA